MPALLEGRRVVKPSRAAYCLGLLSLLVSIAMPLQPTIAQAADGDTTTTVAIPRADTSAQAEPSSNAPVVLLRGTRPVAPAAAEVPNVRNRAPPPPYMGFVPAALTGSGWNTEYNYNGLNYTPSGGAAE
jgi:hypothetical protein